MIVNHPEIKRIDAENQSLKPEHDPASYRYLASKQIELEVSDL